jgi:hypothetical protein
VNFLEIRNQAYFLLREDSPGTGDLAYPQECINQAINAGYRELQEFAGNLESQVSIPVSAQVRFVPLPTDFESVKQLNYVYATTTTQSEWPLDYMQFQNFNWITGLLGRPREYTIRQRRIYLNPIPNNSSDFLNLYYFIVAPTLADNQDIPLISPSFHHLLSYYGAFQGKLRSGDVARADYFRKLWEDGKKRFFIRTKHKQTEQVYPQVRNDWYLQL